MLFSPSGCCRSVFGHARIRSGGAHTAALLPVYGNETCQERAGVVPLASSFLEVGVTVRRHRGDNDLGARARTRRARLAVAARAGASRGTSHRAPRDMAGLGCAYSRYRLYAFLFLIQKER